MSVFYWEQDPLNSLQSVGTKCIFPGDDLFGWSPHTRFHLTGPCHIIHGKQECGSARKLNMGWKWSVLTELISNQLSLSLSEAYLFMKPLKFVFFFRNSSSPLKNRKDTMSEYKLYCRLPTAIRIPLFKCIEMIGPSAYHGNLTLDGHHFVGCL